MPSCDGSNCGVSNCNCNACNCACSSGSSEEDKAEIRRLKRIIEELERQLRLK